MMDGGKMLYIFDKDGTLIAPVGDRPANTPEEQVVMEGVEEKLAELRVEGHDLAIASNQGGVAFGYMTTAEAIDLMNDAAQKTGIGRDRWAACFHHPEGLFDWLSRDCFNRKPNPGMLLQLMLKFDCGPKDTVFVGDRETDRQAAEAAGVEFLWADEFFGREEAVKREGRRVSILDYISMVGITAERIARAIVSYDLEE